MTAGASAPEVLVQSVVAHLEALGAQRPREMNGAVETINFTLPKELR